MSARHDDSITDPAIYAAWDVIKVLRENSRRVATRKYEEGPGAFATEVDYLDKSRQLQRKRRKVQSAYVSRFSARAYADSLPQAVDDSLKELQGICRKRDAIALENEELAAEIERLQALQNGGLLNVKLEATEISLQATEVALHRLEANTGNSPPAWSCRDRDETVFSTTHEDTAFFESRAAATEPETPEPSLQPNHCSFASYFDCDSVPSDLCVGYATDDSVVSDDFTALKAGESTVWQAKTGYCDWASQLTDLVADDMFPTTP